MANQQFRPLSIYSKNDAALAEIRSFLTKSGVLPVLNQSLQIRLTIVEIRPENTAAIKQLGVSASPSMIFDGEIYTGKSRIIEKIRQLCERPASHAAPSVSSYLLNEARAKPEDDEEEGEALSNRSIMEGMAKFNKKKQQLANGTAPDPEERHEPMRQQPAPVQQIRGEPINRHRNQPMAPPVRQQQPGAYQLDISDQNGDRILEDYYLSEAQRSGKVVDSKRYANSRYEVFKTSPDY